MVHQERFAAEMDADAPVYVISVAAELTGLHPQTLRSYDRHGLVSPGRAGGGGRRYSLHDIEALRRVVQLTTDGIGLEGVRRILELEARVEALEGRVAELRNQLGQTRTRLERTLDDTPYLPAAVPRHSSAMVIWRRPRRRR